MTLLYHIVYYIKYVYWRSAGKSRQEESDGTCRQYWSYISQSVLGKNKGTWRMKTTVTYSR